MSRNTVLKLVLAAIAMAVAAAAMWPSARNGFVWDDSTYVITNPLVRELSADGVKRVFTESHFGLYKPVTFLSFAVNYHFSGLNPLPYHATNVALHTINAGLVFLLVLLLVGDHWVAFLCALLFGAHPMHVESVAWISERKDMLYALFFLLCSVLYIRRVQGGSVAAYVVSLVCFGLSLMAKPMGITLPLLLFVYDYLLGRRFDGRLVTEKFTYFLIAGLFALLTLFLLDSAKQMNTVFSLSDRILFVFYGLEFYIGKLLCPLNLSAMYPFPAKNGVSLPLEYWLSPVTVLGCIALLFLFFRRSRAVMAGLAFYMITVAPVLQFVPVGPVITADRYSYIPALGLFLPLSVYAVRLLAKLREKNIRLAAGVTVCMAVCVITLIFAARARCAVWRNDVMLFSDASAKYPAPASLNRFGTALMEVGRMDDAQKVLQTSADLIGPFRLDTCNISDIAITYVQLGRVLYLKGKTELAEKLLRSVLQFTETAPLLLALSDVELKKGNFGAALALAAQATLDPAFRAGAYFQLGDIYMKTGNVSLAAQAYGRGNVLNPSHPIPRSAVIEQR
ncbi:MAG: tetratricopeptide repeat protein [Elusimicrobiaceae bacterium]|nr:tetratricopeptide repeat protein [Elusimicrobiaceae bacterium]